MPPCPTLPRIEIHRSEPGRGYYAIYHGEELVGQRFESQQAPALWPAILRRAIDLVQRAGGALDDRQAAPALDPADRAARRPDVDVSFAAPEGGHSALQRGYGTTRGYSGD